jgi:Tat protein secretion system quality control protein TatD with DNase activity
MFQKRPLTLEDTALLPDWLEKYASSAVCLGECGLDFSKWLCPTSIERDMQRAAIVRQVCHIYRGRVI